MSNYTKKGYRTIVARDKTGVLINYPVKKGSGLDIISTKNKSKAEKQRRQNNKIYKARIRQAKKQFPLAQRAKIKLEDLQI